MQDTISFPVQGVVCSALHKLTRMRKKARDTILGQICAYICKLHHSHCSREQCKSVLCMHYAQSKARKTW